MGLPFPPDGSYEAFISYNSRDQDSADQIAEWLKQRGIRCWLDEEALVPGRLWLPRLARELERYDATVVLIGPSGIGPWQDLEIQTALNLLVQAAGQRAVIPVLLPGSRVDEASGFPEFLRLVTWVDMRGGITEEALRKLERGILGDGGAVGGRTGGAQAGSQDSGGEATRPRLSPDQRALHDTCERVIRSVLRWAKGIQDDTGDPPSDDENIYSCTWSSAGLLWALRESGASFREVWMRRALSWVLDNTNEDGGIPIVRKGDASVTDATAQTALACAGCVLDTGNEVYASKLGRLAEWLAVHKDGSRGWAWRPGHGPSWTASTALALLALSACEAASAGDTVEINEALETGTKWLLSIRNADGGWGSREGAESRPAVTGLVMCVLQRLGRRADALESVDYLVSMFHAEGHWGDAIERPRPDGRTVIRFGAAYGLLGLASCIDDLDAPEIRLGFDNLMRSFRHPRFQYKESDMRTWPTRDGLLAVTELARRLDSGLVRPTPFRGP